MKRKQFLKTCAGGCFLAMGLGMLSKVSLASEFLDQQPGDSTRLLPVPKDRFMKVRKEKVSYRTYIVLTEAPYEWPIVLYRFGEAEYSALLMRCTHQGTELSAHGDIVTCSAHGSEFDTRGQVISGPAETQLQTFEVSTDETNIYIHLV